MCEVYGHITEDVLHATRDCYAAELWGILDDLDILIDRGYDNVLVQTDSFEVANVVKKGLTGRSNSALIRKILQLFSRLQL
ncbi:hypothetical protein Goari_004321 [Gossypium aridum]|uniref:RNase H type-1 domain-containing protein n=1 Tax=Gossypium aridum TaxID=34290 RepID=A0A7J8Y346_GOSAI|nr:hypothetical protein [Gossypium aridum]